LKRARTMNYYGAMLADGLPEGFIETLREALLRVSPWSPIAAAPITNAASIATAAKAQAR
jgi:hypothetical protein